MKRINLFLIFILSIAFSTSSFAQEADILKNFISSIQDATLSFDYTYSIVQDKVEFTGEGSLSSRGKGFKLNSDDFDVYCDGKSKWTIDIAAKEIVIEDVDSTAAVNVLTDNPALILRSINKNFIFKSSTNESGRAYVNLLADKKFEGVDSMVLIFDLDNSSLVGAKIILSGNSNLNAEDANIASPEGDAINIKISNLKISRDFIPDFTFDHQGSLSKKFLVTDLRFN